MTLRSSINHSPVRTSGVAIQVPNHHDEIRPVGTQVIRDAVRNARRRITVDLREVIADEMHRRRCNALCAKDYLSEFVATVEVRLAARVVGHQVTVGREYRCERSFVTGIDGKRVPLAECPDREKVAEQT